MARSNFVTYLGFSTGKLKLDFSEIISASELIVGRCRQLIELMKLCEYSGSEAM